MGRLVGLELFNFKSYKGVVKIGFGDAYFTSIIGPNGSGKSNLMDAISFVLGIRSNQLRSSMLVDLIYRGRLENDDEQEPERNKQPRIDQDSSPAQTEETADESNPTRAYVTCVYQKDDLNEPTKFTRIININGDSSYKIDGKTVTYKRYNEELESENILVRAKNFLVFQGDVERIASQGPELLTNLLEQVSGSVNYKNDYERLKTEYGQASSDYIEAHHVKRKVQNDLKSFREGVQRDEEYRTGLDERDSLTQNLILWELYHLEERRNSLVNKLDESTSQLSGLKTKISTEERLMNKIKSSAARHELKLTSLKESLENIEKEKSSLQSSLLPVGSERLATIKRIANLERRIQSFNRDIERQTNAIGQFENQLKVVTKTKLNFERELGEIHENLSKFRLSTDDLKQYESLKEEYLNQGGSQLEENLMICKNDKSEVDEEIHLVENRIKLSQDRVAEELQIELDELETEIAELTQNLNDKNCTASEKSKKWKSLQTNLESLKNKEYELTFKYRDVLLKIEDINADQRETAKERKLRENVAMLKRLFPGVKGLVHDLCHPKKDKYAVAVSTILGKNFDSIVVDNVATAQECISYLKKQRSGVASFIPLDTIEVAAPSMPFSNAQGCILTTNAIEYESYLEKAMHYVCSDSIICDSLELAKELKWERNVKSKLVTLEGALIHKAGLMTGGVSARTQNRWDKEQYQGLMVMKDEMQEKISEISIEIKNGSINSRELENELSLLNNDISNARIELAQLQRSLESKRIEIRHQEDLIAGEYNNQLVQLQDKRKQFKLRLDELENKKDELQSNIFKPLTDRLGFSMKEYEQSTGEVMRQHSKELNQFEKQIIMLENKLEFEKDRLKVTSTRNEKAASDLECLRQRLEELAETEQKIEDKISCVDAKLSEEKTYSDKVQMEVDSKLRNLIVFETNISDIQASMNLVGRTVDDLKEDIEKIDLEKLGILKNCKLSGVDLPLRGRSLDEIPLDSMNSDSLSLVAALDVEFTELPPQYKDDSSENVKRLLEDEIKAIDTKLELLQPNSKAVQRYAETKGQLDRVLTENEKLRNRERKAKEKFLEVRSKRKELFEKCFNHVQAHIDQIYRALTKNPHDSSELAGGSASLTLENEDEPYMGGVKYFATPPMKRFKDMEYLSGGEKTMAALALLFAVNSYQPSPFFVLDEVDAALDITNVERIAHYIKRRANANAQFIVISLKNAMFEHSQSLVGVYREQHENSSRMLSLNLENYEDK